MNTTASSKYCHSVIHDVSRTFAIGIERMDEPLSSYICVSYLLCRIPDTLEDASHLSSETKKTLLDRYGQLLQQGSASEKVDRFLSLAREHERPNDYWDLVLNTDKVWSLWKSFPEPVRQTTRPHILEMVAGMKTVVGNHPEGIRLQTMSEFRRYCYYVAGTVGNLLTGLFTFTDGLSESTSKELYERAEDFGEALQTVNIIKDVYEDYHRENTVYLPQDRLVEHGGSQDTLFEREQSTIKVLEELIAHAEEKLKRALQYINRLPLKATQPREFCIIPYLLAVATLRESRGHTKDILREIPVKISRDEVAAILSRVSYCLKDNQYLGSLAELANQTKIPPLAESQQLPQPGDLDSVHLDSDP